METERNVKIESSYIFNEKYYIRFFVTVEDFNSITVDGLDDIVRKVLDNHHKGKFPYTITPVCVGCDDFLFSLDYYVKLSYSNDSTNDTICDVSYRIYVNYINWFKWYVTIKDIFKPNDLSHFLVGYIGDGFLFGGLRKLVNFIKR
jgi:hypothetical protein